MFTQRLIATVTIAACLFAAAPAHAQERVVIEDAPSADRFAEMLFGAPPPAGLKMRGIVMHAAQAGTQSGQERASTARSSAAPTLEPASGAGTPSIVAAPVKFDFNSAEIPADFVPTLSSLAEALKRPQAAGKTLVVSGHTDPVGEAGYNEALSQDRADAVAQFLVERGVPQSRLVTIGRGERDLLSPSDHRLNRRVEFEAR